MKMICIGHIFILKFRPMRILATIEPYLPLYQATLIDWRVIYIYPPTSKTPPTPHPKPCPSHHKSLTGPLPRSNKSTPHLGGSPVMIEGSRLSLLDKTKLLYYVNRTTDNLQLYIPSVVAADIFHIVYGEGYLSFSRCYQIVMRSRNIQSLTKLLRKFIWHCPQWL